MLTLFCVILFFAVFGSILKFALRAAWGITKIAFLLVLLPILVLGLFISGIFVLAIPILVILGIVFVVKQAVKA